MGQQFLFDCFFSCSKLKSTYRENFEHAKNSCDILIITENNSTPSNENDLFPKNKVKVGE